jgi:hypothetical protein
MIKYQKELNEKDKLLNINKEECDLFKADIIKFKQKIEDLNLKNND